jgi:hypothetical protein
MVDEVQGKLKSSSCDQLTSGVPNSIFQTNHRVPHDIATIKRQMSDFSGNTLEEAEKSDFYSARTLSSA